MNKEQLEALYGKVWDTSEVTKDFEFIGFGAPFATVMRRVDRVKGSLEFQHRPRFYFEFKEDK